MKKLKKLLALLTAIAMLSATAACGTSESSGSAAETSGNTEASTSAEDTTVNNASADAEYTVGICQLVQHEALDAATEGFMAAPQISWGIRLNLKSRTRPMTPQTVRQSSMDLFLAM